MAREKIRIAFIFGVCLVTSILCFTGAGVIRGKRENQTNISLEIGLWTPETRIEQTFVASENNLSRIDFWIDSYYPWDVPYLECRLFEIHTDQNPNDLSYTIIKNNSTEVRGKKINGWLISGHMFNQWAFAPIPDSEGKRYLFSIQAPEIRTGGTSIIRASSGDRYQYFGNLFVNGERKAGDLAFRVLYQKNRLQVLRESVQKIALQKPGLFSMPATYYVLGGLYVVLIGMFLFYVSTAEKSR